MERRLNRTFAASGAPQPLQDGMTSQALRSPPALRPDYLPLDGRVFPQLVADAIEVADLFHFFSRDNERDGTWRDLFLRDTTAVLAAISAADPAAWEASFSAYERELTQARSRGRKLAALRSCFVHILEVATQVEMWRTGVLGFRTTPLADRVATFLEGLIQESLGDALLRLKNYSEGAGLPGALGEAISLDCADLLLRWRVGPVVPDGSIFGVSDGAHAGASSRRAAMSQVQTSSLKSHEPPAAWRGHTEKPRRAARSVAERADAALPALRELHALFIDALLQIKALPEMLMADSLAQSDHPPHLALFFAFAQVFERAQATLNRIPGRLIDFYYRQVLAQSPLAALPDTVALLGQLKPQTEPAQSFIPAGTRFSAGPAADGSELIFVAREGTTVSTAALRSLRGLRAWRAPIVTFSSPSPRADSLGDLDRVCLVESDLAALLPGDKSASAPASPHSLFGEVLDGAPFDQASAPVGEPAGGQPASLPQYASLGLAIATPCLSLMGGERKIGIELRFSRDSMAALLLRLAPLGGELGMTVERALMAWLPSAFTVSLSTASGWLPIEGVVVELSEALDSDPSFTLRLSLGPSAPAIVPLPTTPAVTNPEPGWPCVQLRVNQQPIALAGAPTPAQIRALPFLAQLQLVSVLVTTEVVALPHLTLSNPEGPIASKPPYPIFGGTPSRHSYLDIHHPEIFAKKLQRLQLGIVWFDLPLSSSGFRGHYQGYVLGPDGESLAPRFDNTVFQVRVSVVEPGLWNIAKAAANRDTYRLFSTHRHADLPAGEEHLEPITTFESIGLSPHGDQPEPSAVDSAIRIELVQPASAFGHAIYASNALHAAQLAVPATRTQSETPAAAPGKPAASAPGKMPASASLVNPPWWPRASEVRLGYEAKDEIPSTLGERDGQVFHVLPFDGFCRLQLDGEHAVSFLPQLAHPAALLLGFSALNPPQPLSLLWHLAAQPSGGDGVARPVPAVTWEYLDGERWLPFSSAQVLADATAGLQHSGIVKLHVPDCSPPLGTVLPGSLHWLRVAVDGDCDAFPALLGVYPNAFLASWDGSSGDGSHLRQPLPAQSIVAGKDKLPAIEKVGQPMPSFGGHPAEDDHALRRRLSERLRHRDRALTVWDYERLVLERFPSIWAVRALPSRDAAFRRAAGHVLLVVLPGPNAQSPCDATAPLCTGQQLAQIQSFLAPRMSPHVQLHVRNPSYVRITVEATVQFRDDSGLSRPAREQLDHDLRHYLSPWSERPSQGSSAQSPQASTWDGEYTQLPLIAEFIARRPYVAALVDLRLHSAPASDGSTDLPPFLTTALVHRIHDRRDQPSQLPLGQPGRTY